MNYSYLELLDLSIGTTYLVESWLMHPHGFDTNATLQSVECLRGWVYKMQRTWWVPQVNEHGHCLLSL
jgi:hypothetical protein